MGRAGLPATATAMRHLPAGRPVARSTDSAASSTESGRNGTHWQRETMVGSMTSELLPNRMNVTPSGGSSSVLSRAFAVIARSCSIRYPVADSGAK